MRAGTTARVVDASFAIDRDDEARLLLKLGFESAHDLEDALSDTGWAVHRGPDGGIDDLDFAGPLLSAEFNDVLPTLGPFVVADSYVVLEVEDGAQCRWDFDGRKCTFVDFGLVEQAG